MSDANDYQVMACLLYSHGMNLANPGTFNTEINEMLSRNGLPPMKFRPNPNSGGALRAQGKPLPDNHSTFFVSQEKTQDIQQAMSGQTSTPSLNQDSENE